MRASFPRTWGVGRAWGRGGVWEKTALAGGPHEATQAEKWGERKGSRQVPWRPGLGTGASLGSRRASPSLRAAAPQPLPRAPRPPPGGGPRSSQRSAALSPALTAPRGSVFGFGFRVRGHGRRGPGTGTREGDCPRRRAAL